jgi:hypothetical protein
MFAVYVAGRNDGHLLLLRQITQGILAVRMHSNAFKGRRDISKLNENGS